MMNVLIAKFKQHYADFSALDLGALAEIYDEKVVFIDPIHQIDGLNAMSAYFAHTREGLNYCQFEFVSDMVDPATGQAALQWLMRFSHPRLAKGQEQLLAGVSWLNIEGKIVLHRDYYDLGEMLYEPIPVLGRVIKSIKRRLGAF